MKKKTIALALVLVMVFGATLGGTFAYLTSQDQVVNTFTVGNVKITMDEAKVNPYGEPVNTAGQTKTEYLAIAGNTEAGWVPARANGNEYKLLPGHTYTKDPTIYVDAKSEDTWLFVKVENGISAIEAAGDTTIANQMKTNWALVSGTTNIYAYNAKVSKNDTIKVFDTFKIADNADIANYATEKNDDGTIKADTTKLIKITAYAIQADGFTTAADAWTAAKLG